jgi:DNA adenine methylase
LDGSIPNGGKSRRFAQAIVFRGIEFTQYSKEAFTWDDQVRAAEWLARHKGPVILSNQATERIVALYEKLGFKLRFLDGPRRISCNGDRRPAKEVLAVRNCG